MKTPLPRSLILLAALTAIASSGCRRSRADRDPQAANDRNARAQNSNALLDQQAQFAPRAQGTDGASAADHYEINVNPGERWVVSVDSTAFDPVLEVVMPDGTALINDDYEGSRQRSQLTVSPRAAGTMKVRVRAYRAGTGGAYHVRVERQATQVAQNTNALAMPTQVQNAYNQMGSGSTPFLEFIQPSESRTHHRLPPQLPASLSTLRPGQDVHGALASSDATLPSGEHVDAYSFSGNAGEMVTIAMNSTTIDPYLLVVSPSGSIFADDDSGGTTNAQLSLVLAESGEYRVLASATRPGVTGAYELKFNPASRQANVQEWFPTQPQPPQGGVQVTAQTRQGTLAQGDQRLNSGEFVDRYTFNWPVGAQLRLRLESSQFDPYLIIRAPSGSQQDNDDASPSDRNSQIDYTVREPGQHTVMVTSYRPGETGAYTLSIAGGTGGQPTAQPAQPDQPQPAQPQPVPAQPGAVPSQTLSGALQAGDGTRPSGEFADNYTFTWPAGAAIRIETTSSEFDTFLIVRSPSGATQQNDDGIPGTTNSALDMITSEAGTYTVTVSSYRAGETGNYQLVVRGAGGGVAQPSPTQPQPVPVQPQPNPTQPNPSARARQITGTLARGDRTLQTGEFVDQHTLQFRPGESVRLRLESSQFDTYLLVRSPSGRQQDNDDLVPGNTNSGIDIPSAEAGNYQVMVTSYRPGETGAYTLRVESGAAGTLPIDNPGVVPSPTQPNQPSMPNVAGGTRVWGIFAGITDYPAGANDLPECANDAVKLVETLTDRGLLTPERRVLLTDAQATRQNIRDAFQRLAPQIGPQDVFVFFYSGHGGRTRGGSTDQRELDGMDEYLYVYDGQLMDDEMGTLFDGVRARTSILALDACYAGGFAKDVITRPGRIGLFSSEEDVTSSVAQRFRAGGYLSHFLRLGMGGEADNDPRDNALTVGELTHYVWRQFAQHGQSIEQGEGAYQHLVVDRGAVSVGQVLWNYPR